MFIGIFVGHLALTLLSVANMIACGVSGGCSLGDRVLDKIVGFPVFRITSLIGDLKPGVHYRGSLLNFLIPINSLVVAGFIFLVFRIHQRSIRS